MKKIWLCFFVSALMASLASASYISLNTSLTLKVVKNSLEVLVAAVNRGDESAYNVQAEIRFGGKTILAEKKQELGVNEAYKAERKIRLDLKKPGQYPLTVFLHYTDANQYPFSALTGRVFSYRLEAAPAQIFGRMRGATFWQEGKAKLSLKNMGDEPIEAAALLVAPRELTVDGFPFKITLLPKSERVLEFTVKNFSALSGSSYQVFAILEYEKGDVHQAVIAPGAIKIVEGKKILGVDQNAVFVVLVLLIAAFFVMQLRGKKKVGA